MVGMEGLREKRKARYATGRENDIEKERERRGRVC